MPSLRRQGGVEGHRVSCSSHISSHFRDQWREECTLASGLPWINDWSAVAKICTEPGVLEGPFVFFDAEQIKAALHFRWHERL